MQTITPVTPTTATTEANISQQHTKKVVNYFLSGMACKISISEDSTKYTCESENKAPHIIKDPIQCEKGHLSCYECIVDVPQSNGEVKKACSVCYLSQPEDSNNLPKEAFVYRKDRCVGRTINSILVDCPAKITFDLDQICSWKGELRELESHLITECKVFPQVQVLQHKVSNIEDQLKKLITNMEKISQDRRLEEKVNRQETAVQQLEGKLNLQERKVQQLEAQSSLEEIFDISGIDSSEKKHINGELVWKIDHVMDKFEKARTKELTAIYSPAFYTEEFGYKFAIKVYLNGDGEGEGTHLSLFIRVMIGEYDDILQWPVNKKITLIVLNQEDIINRLSHSFRTDSNSTSFKQPVTSHNIASGIPFFMRHDHLLNQNKGFLKNDTIFIKASITE